jgi:hypothetical protein
MNNIQLTKEILRRQALLLQEISTQPDLNTGEPVRIQISSCYSLLASTYGFKNWNTLSDFIEKTNKPELCICNNPIPKNTLKRIYHFCSKKCADTVELNWFEDR